MSDGPECRCGVPPYTDGAQCPVCLELHAAELRERVELGAVSPLRAMIELFMSSPRVDSFEGNDEWDEE